MCVCVCVCVCVREREREREGRKKRKRLRESNDKAKKVVVSVTGRQTDRLAVTDLHTEASSDRTGYNRLYLAESGVP